MQFLRVSQNSAPLYRDSGLRPEDFEVQTAGSAAGHQSFFNTVDDIFDTTPLRFCLPHQVHSPSKLATLEMPS